MNKGATSKDGDQNAISALKCYMQALAIKSDHTPSIFNLACNYLKIKDYPEAKKWFEKAIAVTVNDPMPDAYYGLCLACISLG